MVSHRTAFLIISTFLAIVVGRPKHGKGLELPVLRNYVLMPAKYADESLKKHLQELEEVRKESLRTLSELLANQDQLSTHETARVSAHVLERGLDTLLTIFRDVRALAFPNSLLSTTKS